MICTRGDKMCSCCHKGLPHCKPNPRINQQLFYYTEGPYAGLIREGLEIPTKSLYKYKSLTGKETLYFDGGTGWDLVLMSRICRPGIWNPDTWNIDESEELRVPTKIQISIDVDGLGTMTSSYDVTLFHVVKEAQ